MGQRTLKRVLLDFQWPLNKVWEGYINPHPGPIDCKLCDGSGYNQATEQIAKDFYDHDGFGKRWTYDYGFSPNGKPARRPPWGIIGECRVWKAKITQDEVLILAKRHRLMDFTHIWDQEKGRQPKKWETKGFYCPNCHSSVPQLSEDHHSGICTCEGKETRMILLSGDDFRLHLPRAEEVNARELGGGLHTHDSINRWILIEARAKRLGVYGKCSDCRGKGQIQPPRKKKKAYKNWKPYEPPIGDGYQLWETTSEGSPITPVFETMELLAVWCSIAENLGDHRSIPERKWLEMFKEEHGVDSGSMIIIESGPGGNFVGAAVNR